MRETEEMTTLAESAHRGMYGCRANLFLGGNLTRYGKRTLIFCLGLGFLAGLAGGCQKTLNDKQVKQSQNLGKAVDPLQLKVELRIQMDEALADVIASTSDIAAINQDRSVREMTLRAKMRFFDDYLFFLNIEDPRSAFLYSWSAIVKMRQYLAERAEKEKSLRDILQKPIARIKKLEDNIVNLGYKHFPPETIEAAKDDIEKTASSFSWYAASEPQTGLKETMLENDIIKILKLPLAPVTGLGKVGNTPEAINQFSDTVNDFSLIIQYLPERTRWQLELFLLEMESEGPVATIIKEIEQLNNTLQDIGKRFEKFPAELGSEFEKSLAAADKIQPEIRATLTQAEKVSESAKNASESANQTATQAEKAAMQFTKAANALESAADEVRALLADYRQMQPSDPNQERTSIKDYQTAAERFAEAAREIRQVLFDLQKPLPEQAGVRQISEDFRGTIDLLYWRLVMLIAVIFVLLLGYYLAKSKYQQRKRNTT